MRVGTSCIIVFVWLYGVGVVFYYVVLLGELVGSKELGDLILLSAKRWESRCLVELLFFAK
jgi:hypothetical protein